MRIQLIDGLRGYFLIMMMMAHLTMVQPWLSAFSHHRLGFVEDAQGFVFLSGFVIALVYGRLLQKTSFDVMRIKLYARIQQLYIYNFMSLAVVFALAYSGFEFADKIHDMARIGENAWQDMLSSASSSSTDQNTSIFYRCIFALCLSHHLYCARSGTAVCLS